MSPASQAMQTDAYGALYCPMLQLVHDVEPLLPANCPAGHATHAARPVLGPYVPTTHGAHDDALVLL